MSDTDATIETALGGATLDELRERSTIVPEITRSLDFHGTPVAAQVLREVLGEIERACTEASGRRPKNRKGEFQHLDLSTLRQLAALCRVWAPRAGAITSPREVAEAATDLINTLDASIAKIDAATAPTISGPPLPHEIVTDEQRAASDASVAAFETQAIAEGATAAAILTDVLGAEPVSPNGHEPTLPVVHAPDPWIEPQVPTITLPNVYAADAEPGEVVSGK